jgi:hypothetical protein
VKRPLSFLDRYIDPSDWWGEVLFGLIMVLIFTLGARSIVARGEDATRDLLMAVIGCNIGWGIISGGMFVIDALFERSRKVRLARDVQKAPDEEHALAVIRDELDTDLELVTSDEERLRLYRHILDNVKKMELPKTRVTRADLFGALVVFVLVVLTTVPAVLPFLVIGDLRLALRTSNLLLVGMLFVVGYRWAGQTNTNPWLAGVSVMIVGLGMVVVAELLGG